MMHFYQCKQCNDVIISFSLEGLICCNEDMMELVPNETDGAREKHVPTFQITDQTITVNVGEISHPMEEEHSILWVVLAYADGYDYRRLEVGKEPKVTFHITHSPVAIYAYCNLHGLWKVNIS